MPQIELVLRDARPGDTLVVVDFASPGSNHTLGTANVRVTAENAHRTLGDGTAGPVPLVGSGPFGIVLSPAEGATLEGVDIALFRYSAAPESTPRTLPVGARVTERIDFPADIDEYVLHGVAGQEVRVQLVTDPAGSLDFRLLQPNGYWPGGASKRDAVPATAGVFRFPKTGDYYLVIQPSVTTIVQPEGMSYSVSVQATN